MLENQDELLPLVRSDEPRLSQRLSSQFGALQQREADLVILRRYMEKAERLMEALMHYWKLQTCPCGARIESPNTHPHVTGCPVGIALYEWKETP